MEAWSYQEVLAFAHSWDSVYFLTLFCVALVYALWPSNRTKFRDAASIPLREGDES